MIVNLKLKSIPFSATISDVTSDIRRHCFLKGAVL
jgi:hypothetical protein